MDTDLKPADRPKSLREALDSRATETSTPPSASNFQTPEEVAANDDIDSSVDMGEEPPVAPKAPQSSGSRWDKFKLHWPPGRKEYLVVGALLILITAGVCGWLLTHQSNPAVPKAVKAKFVPKTVASTLSGLQVDPAINKRPVTAVMIENSTDARPQSGLSEASVVFEAIAEGGITRFLTLFQDTNPADVGPIRSARPYYVSWAAGFDAGYAHVGGSPDGLAAIKTIGVKDLDQFANAGAYHRVSSRAAPHNVYTPIDTLIQLQAAKGYTGSKFTGFLRKKEAPAKVPTAKTIDLTISGPTYNVHYDYVAATNSYNRSEGGAAHMDANGNKQISPKVVIALIMPYSLNGKYSVYGNVGSGQAMVFQDGTVTTGTWTKASDKDQIKFTDAAGKALKLNPGQTWLTALGSAPSATYAP